MKLIIVGNGFDINYGLNTKYSDFQTYLSDNNPDLLDKINLFYYGSHLKDEMIDQNVFDFNKSFLIDVTNNKQFIPHPSCLWSSFEAGIANLSYEYINNYYGIGRFPIENLEETIESIKIELVELLSKTKQALANWIRTINDELLDLNCSFFDCKFKDDLIFLTFNYTNTLELAFDVNKCNILHVHGTADNDIVVGCSKDLINDYYVMHAHYGSTIDKSLVKTLKVFIKPVQSIICSRIVPFIKNKPIDSIVVLGMSINSIDKPYLDKIVDLYPNADWTCSYFSNDDYENITNYFYTKGKRCYTKRINDILAELTDSHSCI